MFRAWLAAPLLLVVLAATPAPTPAPTPASTEALTAGAPAGPWEVYSQGTGPRTAVDIWGNQASSVKGFGDAYQRSWDQTGQGLLDRLERFTSVFWSALRLTESEAAARRNPGHSSVTKMTGLGAAAAYETTDPPDAHGFLTDTIVFTYGDYVAVVALAAVEAVPRATLLDQVNRQLDLLPLPVAEYQALGNGIVLGGTILVGAFIGFVVLAAVVVTLAIVLSRRRRPSAAGAYAALGALGGGLQLSPDRRYWWDGQAWQDASMRVPPGVQISADGAQWWDGTSWRPVPPGGATL
jgi:hypothetical protein